MNTVLQWYFWRFRASPSTKVAREEGVLPLLRLRRGLTPSVSRSL